MQKLVGDHCMPVDVDTELGMLVTIGIVVVAMSVVIIVTVAAVWWVDCAHVCTAVWLSARGCGGDHCHCGWVDQVWACS